MPKSRPEIFNFLDALTSHLRYIGKDQLASHMERQDTREAQAELIRSGLSPDQLAFDFQFPVAA